MTPAPQRSTPLTHWHVKHAAQMQDDHGWQVPRLYTSLEKETAVAREALVMADLSHLPKISLRGPDMAAVGRELTSDALAAPRGVAWLGTRGVDLACQLTDDHLLLLAGETSKGEISERLGRVSGQSAWVQHDVTSAYAGFGLLGPRVEAVVQRLTALDISADALPAGRCAETNLAGVHAVVIHPPHTQGADGPRSPDRLRIYVSWDLGEYVWETVVETGRKHGLEPIGMECYTQLASGGR